MKKFLTLCLLLGLTSACGVKKDSPAPGCVEYWGLAPMGGCAGESAILDLTVEPDLDCLTVEVNNCNGGVLEVSNLCEEPLTLGGVEIPAGERSASLDVAGQEDGRYVLAQVYSNFSDYVPAQDEHIQVAGRLGSREIWVRFIKTAKLC